MNEQTARILEATADLLEHEGWIRGTWVAWGRRCLVGALNSATRTELELKRSWGAEFCAARDAAGEHLAQVIWGRRFEGIWELTEWNDHERRRKQDVLDVCRKAAKRAYGVKE